ncbi:ATP-dependent helicase [candidate division WOR-3 bacterium]|nr:ATP-dependent helicase [candidate division WOR-3 bacterium]
MTLNNYEEIVSNFASPTLVLAGPGAGKTYLLADRIKRLLGNGTDKSSITALTFGKDANQYMINKITEPSGFNIPFNELPHISTMHSLGFEIVREKPHDVNLRKTDLKVQGNENVQKLMYRDAALILGYTENDSKEALKCKQYGDCKENSEEKKCQVCGKYWEIMSKCNYVDFDDQILFACRILEKNPTILEKYQLRAKHLLVDEYQDINTAQFRLIELLSRESRNGLFVVGDDAQSIYGFRGSDPKFILRFKEDFHGSETPSLAYSRRCHEKIMQDAIKVLKKYYTAWTGEQKLKYEVPIGEEPDIWQLPSDKAEAKMVAIIARQFIQEKKSILILVPKKEFFPLITQELSKRSIVYGCPISFLPKRIEIVKLFVDWVTNPSDSFETRLVIEELINKGIAHVPGIKKDRRTTPETIKKRIAEETKIAKLWEQVKRGNDLFSVIKNIEKPNETLTKIQKGLLNLNDLSVNLKKEKHGEFIKQLAVVSGIWCKPSELMDDILKITKLLNSQNTTGLGWVQLNTIKKAKGLEADVVIMVGLENDIVPNPRGDPVEESRLFYVSMTRAKEKLYLFHAYKRPRNISYGAVLMDKPRSRFLDIVGRKSEWKK